MIVPEATPVEHHRSVEYQPQDFRERSADFRVTPLADGHRIQVAGLCPSCGGHTTTTWSYGSGNGYKGLRIRRSGPEAPADTLRTVCCDCGHAHPNRPDTDPFIGCGAYWQVDLA
jgi:rRNA maturation protein Nop10